MTDCDFEILDVGLTFDMVTNTAQHVLQLGTLLVADRPHVNNAAKVAALFINVGQSTANNKIISNDALTQGDYNAMHIQHTSKYLWLCGDSAYLYNRTSHLVIHTTSCLRMD